jgi:hypothetical protein
MLIAPGDILVGFRPYTAEGLEYQVSPTFLEALRKASGAR